MNCRLFSLALLGAAFTGAFGQAPTAPIPEPPAPATPAPAVALTPAEAEARRCEEKIASARRDTMGRYDSALVDLQNSFQKAADLEGALAVRSERERALQSGTLTEANFVAEPKALRALQMQMATRNQDLINQLVSETLPRLTEAKRQFTIAGRLDDALAVRTAIERLQDTYLTVVHPDPGVVLSAETILRAYTASRARADLVYKGRKLQVRGTVAGFRTDPNDSRQYLLYLATPNTPSWILCSFATGEFRIREDKQFNQQTVLFMAKDTDAGALRLQRGSAVDIVGNCVGWDESVRMQRCELPKSPP